MHTPYFLCLCSSLHLSLTLVTWWPSSSSSYSQCSTANNQYIEIHSILYVHQCLSPHTVNCCLDPFGQDSLSLQSLLSVSLCPSTFLCHSVLMVTPWCSAAREQISLNYQMNCNIILCWFFFLNVYIDIYFSFSYLMQWWCSFMRFSSGSYLQALAHLHTHIYTHAHFPIIHTHMYCTYTQTHTQYTDTHTHTHKHTHTCTTHLHSPRSRVGYRLLVILSEG